MASNTSRQIQGSSRDQNNVVYEPAPTNEQGGPSAPPYSVNQDAPPSYDEAILDKQKESEGVQLNYQRQPGLPIKGDYNYGPGMQFGPG